MVQNGVAITGATLSELILNNVSTSDAALYSVSATNVAGTTLSQNVRLTVSASAPTPTPNPTPAVPVSLLSNISTRGYTANGDNILIAGFIINGNENHRVLIRALGPTLSEYGVSTPLKNTSIELYQGSTKIGANAGWAGSADVVEAMGEVNASAISTTSLDSALAVNLAPGGYTVEVRSADTSSGISLVEVYDLPTSEDPSSRPHLINISTRGYVGTGEQQLIAGFIITGGTSKKVLIRALGPTLKNLGVAAFLADPKIELHDANGIIGQNDNWGNDPDISAVMTKQNLYPLPANSKDAAILTTLSPGGYTAIVSGADGGTGIGLIEVYEVNN